MSSPPDLYARAVTAVDHIRSLASIQPRVGIILGSGLAELAELIDSPVVIAYADIPHFPIPGVEGHAGNLILGFAAGVPVAVMQGRVHAYEGFSMAEVTFPTRVLGLLGVSTLIVTNAAGGIDPGYAQGSIVAIRDHINLTGQNAAGGPNEPRFARSPDAGLRFFDMSSAYSPHLRQIAKEESSALGFTLQEGVYIAVSGPSYETPAEIRAFRILGADLVGMSTVHEVIVARHMGLDVLGLSLVTNAAAGVTSEPIHHAEVMETGREAAARFGALLRAILPRIEPAASDLNRAG
jgi:purine-nucleoside phosphorylase